MIESRWQLPDAPLRTSVLAAQLGGVALAAASAWTIQAGLHLTATYPWAASAAFAAAMSVAIGFLAGAHPFATFGAANQITMVRLVLVTLAASFLGERLSAGVAWIAVGVSVAATALDGVDGWLARRRNMTSAFGARFDMEIDALLILALSALAYRGGKAGAWVLASGLLRYAFVASGSVAPWMRTTLPPSYRRKTICVVQVVALIIVLSPILKAPASAAVAAFALAVLSYSFIADTLWLYHHAP